MPNLRNLSVQAPGDSMTSSKPPTSCQVACGNSTTVSQRAEGPAEVIHSHSQRVHLWSQPFEVKKVRFLLGSLQNSFPPSTVQPGLTRHVHGLHCPPASEQPQQPSFTLSVGICQITRSPGASGTLMSPSLSKPPNSWRTRSEQFSLLVTTITIASTHQHQQLKQSTPFYLLGATASSSLMKMMEALSSQSSPRPSAGCSPIHLPLGSGFHDRQSGRRKQQSHSPLVDQSGSSLYLVYWMLVGDEGLAVVAPLLWNSLPQEADPALSLMILDSS